MGDINTPRALAIEESFLKMVELATTLMDPSEKDRIAESIIEHHKLNDTEANKAAEARALIKSNQESAEKNRLDAETNRIESEKIVAAKLAFDEEMRAGRYSLSEEKSKVDAIRIAAEKLSDEAAKKIAEVSAREFTVASIVSDHEANVAKLAADKIAMDKYKAELDAYKAQVETLAAETKTKLETLKKLNF